MPAFISIGMSMSQWVFELLNNPFVFKSFQESSYRVFIVSDMRRNEWSFEIIVNNGPRDPTEKKRKNPAKDEVP